MTTVKEIEDEVKKLGELLVQIHNKKLELESVNAEIMALRNDISMVRDNLRAFGN